MSANVQGIPTPVKWVPRGHWERRFSEGALTGVAGVVLVDDGDTGPVSDSFSSDAHTGLAAAGAATWDYVLVDCGANPGGTAEIIGGAATATVTSNGATLVACSGSPGGQDNKLDGVATITGVSHDATFVRSSGDPDELCTGLARILGTAHN